MIFFFVAKIFLKYNYSFMETHPGEELASDESYNANSIQMKKCFLRFKIVLVKTQESSDESYKCELNSEKKTNSCGLRNFGNSLRNLAQTNFAD